MGAMHDVAVPIEDVRLFLVRLACIEGEKFIRDGNSGISRGGDRLEQLEGAAKFFVEHGARKVVATLGAAAEKKPTSQLLVRLVDCDVLAGHPSVPDEQCGRRQSAKSSTNDMRPHGPSP